MHQHRNAVGKGKHGVHVVLDHQQRTACSGRANQFDGARRFGAVHAGSGLVEQQGVRAACKRKAEVERALFGIAERAGLDMSARTQPHGFEHLLGARIDRA